MYLRRLQSCFLVMVEDVLSESDWFLEAVDLGKVVSFVVESVLVRGIVLEEEVEVEFLEVLWDLSDSEFLVDTCFEMVVSAVGSNGLSLKIDRIS